MKYSIRENKAHPGVGYVCLAEQYLHVELVIYLHNFLLGFTELPWQIICWLILENFFEECINFGPCRYGGWWEGWSMWVEETAREEKLSNTND